MDDNNGSIAPINQQASIYSKCANSAALRFGIHSATKQCHKTKKSLTILSDVTALQQLDKELMEWGHTAQDNNSGFNPQDLP